MTATPATSGRIDVAATSRQGSARRRLWLAGLAAVAVAAIVVDGAWQGPADPVEPLILQKQDRVGTLDSSVLRVATFNIHAGVGRDGIRDLGRTAAALPNLDVVALQEVRNPFWGFHGPQVSAVADKLGMAWLFVPAESRWWRNDYGNGLLTRAPLADCVRIPLPTPARHRFRAAFLANFVHQGRTVHLLAVHIDRDLEQNTHDGQLHTVADLFLSLSEPAILMGDMNDFRSHPEIVRLLATAGVHNALADAPPPSVKSNPIDWIITRGFRTVHAEWRPTPSSDHPVACAELELSEGIAGRPNPAARTASVSLLR